MCLTAAPPLGPLNLRINPLLHRVVDTSATRLLLHHPDKLVALCARFRPQSKREAYPVQHRVNMGVREGSIQRIYSEKGAATARPAH